MKAILSQQKYWRRTQRLTWGLLAVWVGVTYVGSWFSRELNEISFLGFPLGFYMGAQGSLFVYLGIVWYYCRAMNRLETQSSLEKGRR